MSVQRLAFATVVVLIANFWTAQSPHAQAAKPFVVEEPPVRTDIRQDFKYPIRMTIKRDSTVLPRGGVYPWYLRWKDVGTGTWIYQDSQRSFAAGTLEITRDHRLVFKPLPSPAEHYLIGQFDHLNKAEPLFAWTHPRPRACDRPGAPPCQLYRGDPRIASTLVAWLALEGFEVTEIEEIK